MGRRFELQPGGIQAAVARACAEAAMRGIVDGSTAAGAGPGARGGGGGGAGTGTGVGVGGEVRQKDFLAAGDAEVAKVDSIHRYHGCHCSLHVSLSAYVLGRVFSDCAKLVYVYAFCLFACWGCRCAESISS